MGIGLAFAGTGMTAVALMGITDMVVDGIIKSHIHPIANDTVNTILIAMIGSIQGSCFAGIVDVFIKVLHL